MENQEMLQVILSEIREIKTDVSGLKQDVSGLKEDVSGLKEDVSGLKAEVTKINIRLENDVEKRLQLLAEGQRGMNEKFQKLDQVAADVEEIKLTTRALEAVTQRNSNDIRHLRSVK